jgi:anti-sigma regulatory factor (Ser/Thr protein kinase)
MVRAQFSLPPVRASARAAREELQRLLASWGDEDSRHVVYLLVSELVTNAVLHARSPVTVRLETTVHRETGEGVLRVQVEDASPIPPVRRVPRGDRPGGRGLQLLDTLAARWGVLFGGTGKSVWFELTVEPVPGD